MANILLERDKAVIQESDDRTAPKHNAITSFEAEIFRRVIKENWKSRISDENSKQVVAMLEEHATAMQKMFNSYEYEILCLPNIIATCKRMSKGDVRRYLRLVEALAVGYKNKYAAETVSLLLAGLAIKAKDIETIQRYYGLLTNELEGKITRYSTAASALNRNIDALSLSLSYQEASLFARLFKKGEMATLRKRIDSKAKRKKKLEERRVRYHGLLTKVKTAATPAAPPPDEQR